MCKVLCEAAVLYVVIGHGAHTREHMPALASSPGARHAHPRRQLAHEEPFFSSSFPNILWNLRHSNL